MNSGSNIGINEQELLNKLLSGRDSSIVSPPPTYYQEFSSLIQFQIALLDNNYIYDNFKTFVESISKKQITFTILDAKFLAKIANLRWGVTFSKVKYAIEQNIFSTHVINGLISTTKLNGNNNLLGILEKNNTSTKSSSSNSKVNTTDIARPASIIESNLKQSRISQGIKELMDNCLIFNNPTEANIKQFVLDANSLFDGKKSQNEIQSIKYELLTQVLSKLSLYRGGATLLSNGISSLDLTIISGLSDSKAIQQKIGILNQLIENHALFITHQRGFFAPQSLKIVNELIQCLTKRRDELQPDNSQGSNCSTSIFYNPEEIPPSDTKIPSLFDPTSHL